MRHNLIDAIPEQIRSSRLVLCRNVLIYFSADHARTFLDRVADTMPAAEVFLGAAETMWSVSDRYETVRADDTFYHRQRAGSPTLGKSPSDRAKPVLTHRDPYSDSANSAASQPDKPFPTITPRDRTDLTSTPEASVA